jgi:hypothetical protein
MLVSPAENNRQRADHERFRLQYAVVKNDLNHNMLSFVKVQGRNFWDGNDSENDSLVHLCDLLEFTLKGILG